MTMQKQDANNPAAVLRRLERKVERLQRQHAEARRKDVRTKHNPASTTLNAPALHGPLQGNPNLGGAFSYPGVRPERFSAMPRPLSIARLLAPTPSEFADEILEIMTGQAAGGTTNANGWCGNPPEAGAVYTCQQVIKFGKYLIKSSLNAVPEIGKLRNRAEVPAVILNAGPQANPLLPDALFSLNDPRSQLGYELFRIGTDLERTLEQVLIVGTAGTDANRTGWWSEFNGLDKYIKTGYTDAVSSVACPAADSAVTSWNALITATVGGRSFIEALTDLFYGVKDRARAVGMDTTEFAFVMRADTYRAVVENWACSYATYRCTGAQYNEVNRDGMVVQQLRTDMLRGQYLLVDGMPVPVVFSEGVPRQTIANNTYNADIYVVPIAWDGVPLLRLEYFKLDNPYAAEFAGFVDPETVITMNNGMFIVSYRSTGLCVEYHIGAQFRLILETPFLAGRLDDVQYTFYAPIREAIPGSSFYADGGVSTRS